MPSPKVIQLRQILAERFPGLRLHLNENPASKIERDPRVLSPALDLFENRLIKGALNELVAGRETSGSATLMRTLIGWAADRNQIMAVVDGCDSLDLATFEPSELARLLWVRCSDAETSMKAMDLLLRDGNLPLVLLDLKLNPQAQLRAIPATTWYRLQRLVETTSTMCLVLTPQPMIASAQARFILKSGFSLPDLERDAGELVQELKWDADDSSHFQKSAKLQTA